MFCIVLFIITLFLLCKKLILSLKTTISIQIILVLYAFCRVLKKIKKIFFSKKSYLCKKITKALGKKNTRHKL